VTEGDLSDLRRGNYLFLDESAKKRFGEFHVGEYREMIGHRFKIIGKTRDALSFSTTPIVFLDFRRAQEMSPDELQGNTTYILVRLAPGADVEAVRREIQRRLPHNDVHTGPEWASQSRRYWVESTGLGLNLAMTIFLGCLVGVVVVAQTLYASTMEHIKEFGTVKAIGGSNLDIYRILAEQATISAIVGFLLGSGFSWLLGPAMAKIDLKLIISPSFAAIVGVGTLILCLAAAMISFRKVARIDPALVFRG
jgi:putative ABC transport system permease protein